MTDVEKLREQFYNTHKNLMKAVDDNNLEVLTNKEGIPIGVKQVDFKLGHSPNVEEKQGQSPYGVEVEPDFKLDSDTFELLQNYSDGLVAFLSVIKEDRKVMEELRGEALKDKLCEFIGDLEELDISTYDVCNILKSKVEDEDEDEEEEPVKKNKLKKIKIEDLKKAVEGFPCSYTITRGKNKGKVCGTMSKVGSTLCKKHTKCDEPTVIVEPVVETK